MGITIYVIDDYLNPRVAIMQGTWLAQISPNVLPFTVTSPLPYIVYANVSPSSWELLNATPTAGDWAQVQYTGWGFRMLFRTAFTLGLCDIYLDGVLVIRGLDLAGSGASAVDAVLGATVTPSVGYLLVTVPNVPLDMHRVKIVASGVRGSGGGTGVIFPSMEYIY